jgi:hypothetical protein
MSVLAMTMRRKRGNVKRSTAHRVSPDATRHCPSCVERDRWWVTIINGQCPRCGAQYPETKKAPAA